MFTISRKDFTKDCEPIFKNIEALIIELSELDKYWIDLKYRDTDLYSIIFAEGFDGKDRTCFERIYGEGKQFETDTRYCCSAISDVLKCPDLTSYINNELNWVIDRIPIEKDFLFKAQIAYEKYSQTKGLYVIREMLDLLKEQTELIERVLPVFVSQLKRTEQYSKENNLQIDKSSIPFMNHSPITNHGNLIITLGNGNSVKVKIQPNDQKAFREKLQESGLDQNSIQELITIVDEERENISDSNLNPILNRIIHKISEKAIDGTWSIPFGIAGSFLYDLIKQHYGIQ